jgi:hypothetical protein
MEHIDHYSCRYISQSFSALDVWSLCKSRETFTALGGVVLDGGIYMRFASAHLTFTLAFWSCVVLDVIFHFAKLM